MDGDVWEDPRGYVSGNPRLAVFSVPNHEVRLHAIDGQIDTFSTRFLFERPPIHRRGATPISRSGNHETSILGPSINEELLWKPYRSSTQIGPLEISLPRGRTRLSFPQRIVLAILRGSSAGIGGYRRTDSLRGRRASCGVSLGQVFVCACGCMLSSCWFVSIRLGGASTRSLSHGPPLPITTTIETGRPTPWWSWTVSVVDPGHPPWSRWRGGRPGTTWTDDACDM